ncbi:hypothetical protein P7K49_005384, partial [Saguinus oedipus]
VRGEPVPFLCPWRFSASLQIASERSPRTPGAWPLASRPSPAGGLAPPRCPSRVQRRRVAPFQEACLPARQQQI